MDILDEVKIILKELAESQKKTDEQQKKTEEEIRELKESQKKTDEQQKKTEELHKKTEEQGRKTEKRLEEFIKKVSELTDAWGDYTEGVALPPVRKGFIGLGFELEDNRICLEKSLNGKKEEIDVLLLGNKNETRVVFACEVKTTLNIKKVDKVIEDLNNFFLFFPEYKDRELIGAIAAIKARKESIEYAKKKGLYVFSPSGDTMLLLNPESQPMIWRYKG